MKLLMGSVLIMALSSVACADITTRSVKYNAGGTEFEGYIAYDSSKTGKQPTVLIFPEWWGLNDYPKERAQQLAKAGYVAFAADMYGKGQSTKDAKQAGQWATAVKGDRKLMRERTQAALDAACKQDVVDPSKVAAIGYCFGGTCALEMARANQKVLGIASFHGGLDVGNGTPAANIHPRVIAFTGGEDPTVPDDLVTSFKNEMRKANADWEVVVYSGARHGFTNPANAGHASGAVAYNKNADMRSWASLQLYLQQLFNGGSAEGNSK
jgi:dienelactone hydrolase